MDRLKWQRYIKLKQLACLFVLSHATSAKLNTNHWTRWCLCKTSPLQTSQRMSGMDRFVKNKRKVKPKPFFFFCHVLRKNHNWPDLDSKNVSNLMLKSSWAPQDRVSIQRRSKCFMSRYLAEHITGTHVSSICHKSASPLSPPPSTHTSHSGVAAVLKESSALSLEMLK